MHLNKGVEIQHYKGGKYTVIDQGTFTGTLEDVIIYQNNVDKKLWVRPFHEFYEEVSYKGKFVPRFEIIPVGPYGGTPTFLKTLEVGTKFLVHNGYWRGEIVMKDGVKCCLVIGDDLKNAREISDNYSLDITVIDNNNEE